MKERETPCEAYKGRKKRTLWVISCHEGGIIVSWSSNLALLKNHNVPRRAAIILHDLCKLLIVN